MPKVWADGAELVIVPCGGRKQAMACSAGGMYIGPYHQACRKWAEQYRRVGGLVLILSAKYGLLKLTDQIEPYNLRMGEKGCVQAHQVREQAKGMGLLDRSPLCLGGKEYLRICRIVWPTAKVPVPQVAIGKQLKWLKEHSCSS